MKSTPRCDALCHSKRTCQCCQPRIWYPSLLETFWCTVVVQQQGHVMAVAHAHIVSRLALCGRKRIELLHCDRGCDFSLVKSVLRRIPNLVACLFPVRDQDSLQELVGVYFFNRILTFPNMVTHSDGENGVECPKCS